MTDTNESAATNGYGFAAFVHVGAMLLAFLAPPLQLIAPLVLLMFAGKKGTFLNNQLREVVRFQLLTSIFAAVVVFAMAVLVGTVDFLAAGLSLLLVPLFLLAVFAPLVAAVRVAQGKDYAYPFVLSPRRAAYKAAAKKA